MYLFTTWYLTYHHPPYRSERENIFVFIGKNLDHDWLKQCFMACLVSDTLRFKVGDLVQANIGEFTDGKIVKTWKVRVSMFYLMNSCVQYEVFEI